MKKWMIFFILTSSVVSAKEVTLKWKQIDGAKKYNLEVSQSEDFSHPVISKTLKQNTLKYKLDSGIYYLRVQGVDVLDRPGIWSKPFELAVTAPVQPVEKTAVTEPKTIRFVHKVPDVQATWNADPGATGFHVVVEKNGQEVFTEDTETPKVDFKPKEPGEYKVKVSSELGKYVGPSVVVETVNVEQHEAVPLAPPVVDPELHKRWSSKKPIDLAWQPVPGAEKYNVKIFKLTVAAKKSAREPASLTKTLVAQFPTGTDGHVEVPPLPPGRYIASIEAANDGEEEKSSSDYKFDVKRTKPVEFEKIDLAFHYKFTQIKYQASVQEAQSGQQNTNSLGGAGEIKGTLFFPDSNFGVRVDGVWGGFLVNNFNITYNDLSLAAAYKMHRINDWLGTDMRAFFGARIMTEPVIVNANNNNGSGNGSSSSTQTQVFTPTLFGPTGGFDIYKAIGEKFSLLGTLQLTFPTSSSSIGAQVSRLDPGQINGKIELGAGYKIQNNMRLVAMLGFQSDKMKWIPSSQGSGSTTTFNGDSSAETDATSFIVGVETSDDLSMSETDRFSELNLDARYIYEAFNYSAKLQENAPNSGSSSGTGGQFDSSMMGAFGGAIEIEGVGWLNHSRNGIRLLGAWQGVTVNGSNISFPEFYAQWALRPLGQAKRYDWQFNNYLGARSWVVPDFEIQGPNSGNSNGGGSPARMPQLLGVAETAQVTKRFSNGWIGTGILEFSMPLILANTDSEISKIVVTNTSGKAELRATRIFTEDFSATLGAGYKYDQLRYDAPGYTDSASSLIQNWAPTASLGITYSF